MSLCFESLVFYVRIIRITIGLNSYFHFNRRSVDSPFLHVVDKPRTQLPVKHKKQTRSKSKSRQKRQDDVTETEEIGMHGIDIFNNNMCQSYICIL